MDLTSKLDNEWKEMQKVMKGLFKENNSKNEKIEITSSKDEDYDKLVQTLKYDLKAQPTDKLKSLEEIEKERLLTLREAEEQLIKRMNLKDNDLKQEPSNLKQFKIIETTHRSIDDMDFNDFTYESSKQKKRNLRVTEEENENNIEGEKKLIEQNDENTNSNEEWFKFLTKAFDELLKEKIKIEDFEKNIDEIIKKLNPGLNENNKNRLYLMSQHLIEFYKKNSLKVDSIDYKLLNCLSKIIFHISTVYLKDKIGDIFHELIKEQIGTQVMPNMDTVITILYFITFFN